MSTVNQPLAVLQVSTLPLLTRLRLRRPSPLTPTRSRLLRGRPISVPPIYSSDPSGNPPVPDAQSPNVKPSSFSGSIPSQPKRPLSSFSVGEVVDGVVKNVVPFGCFVDVGGVEDFLVHASDFADAYIKDPSKVVSKGDPVKLEILQIMANKMKGSFKGLNGFEEKLRSRSPAQREASPEKEYSTSEFFEGVVERVTVSGAIVRFDDGGTTGFLPIEEMSNVDTGEDAQPSASDHLTAGQKMDVRVMEYQSRNNIVLTTRSVEEEAEDTKLETEGLFFSDIDPKDYAILKTAFEKAGLISNMFNKSTEDATEAPAKAVMESEISTADDAIIEIQNETTTQVETPPPPAKEEEPIVAEIQEDTVLALPEDPVSEVQEEPSAKIQEEPVVEIQEDSSPVIPEETVAEVPQEAIEEIEEAPVDTAQEEPAAAIQEEPIPVTPEEAVAEIPEQVTEEETVNELPEESVPQAEEAPADETEKEPVSELEQAPNAEVQEAPPSADAKPQISAQMVKELRDITGAGMLDCKKALTESAGNIQSAMEYLKKKGIASASKRAGRVASEGLIASYVHHGDKLGILLEVNSETDFVARNDQFKNFVNDVAMTLASCPEAICVNPEDFPADLLEKEKEIELSSEELLTKPESIREKIISGKLEKLKKTGSLLQQKFIRNQEITVQDALNEVTAALGEKILIRRFERFVLGEGLEKKSTAFATEVTDQIEAKIAEAAVAPTEDQEPVSDSPAIPEQPEFKVSAVQVKELRVMTGGGFMDCKNALIACQGDLDAASEVLRKKGLAGAAKKADRLASEGAIGGYVHVGSKLGVMVEVNCETDFVSRSEVFKELVQDIKLMITACPEVQYITDDEIPQSVKDAELELEMQKEDLLSKDEDLRQKIAEGRLSKALKSFCLFDQPTLKDSTKTVREMIQEAIAALGENIRVRRFVRFNLGEGIEKEETNFADEVKQQVQTT